MRVVPVKSRQEGEATHTHTYTQKRPLFDKLSVNKRCGV